MQLTGEVKDDAYADLPRQQQAEYAPSTDTFLRSDASTGRHYYDLNAATKAYSGPWLFGKQHVEVLVGNLKAQWLQWCPVPADIRDGVLMRGNVIYQNPDGSYRISGDLFEGVIRTEHGLTSERFLIGRTQHTFYGPQLPNGRMQVIANLRIPLTERLSYNPMIPRSRSEQPAVASYSSYPSDENAPEHQWSQVVTQQTPDYQTPASYPQQAAPMSSSWLQSGQNSGASNSQLFDPDSGF